MRISQIPFVAPIVFSRPREFSFEVHAGPVNEPRLIEH
jgi:hypothetical protein